MEYIVFGILWLIFALLGTVVGNAGGKRNGELGFVLGLILGPLGILVAALLPANTSKPKWDPDTRHGRLNPKRRNPIRK